MNWISVKDRLPRHGERVLVVLREPNPLMDREIIVAFYHESDKMWYADCDSCQWKHGERELDGKSTPTEWMNLPEWPENNT